MDARWQAPGDSCANVHDRPGSESVHSRAMQRGANSSFANTKWRLVFRSRRSMGLDEGNLSCCEHKTGEKNNLTSTEAL